MMQRRSWLQGQLSPWNSSSGVHPHQRFITRDKIFLSIICLLYEVQVVSTELGTTTRWSRK